MTDFGSDRLEKEAKQFEYQLDVSPYPERIELKKSINQIRLSELCQILRTYGYLYMDPLKAFLKGEDAHEV